MTLAAVLAGLGVIVAGAVWLVRRLQRIAVAEVAVDAARKTEAADVAKADATLTTERAKDPIDVVNRRFGRNP